MKTTHTDDKHGASDDARHVLLTHRQRQTGPHERGLNEWVETMSAIAAIDPAAKDRLLADARWLAHRCGSLGSSSSPRRRVP